MMELIQAADCFMYCESFSHFFIYTLFLLSNKCMHVVFCFFCQMRLPSTWNDKLNLKQIYRVPGCQEGGPKRIKAEVKRVPEFQGGGLQVPTSSGTGRGHRGLKGVTVAEYFSHLVSRNTPHYWSLRLSL